MARNLKVLGVALVALFATSAVLATAAMAQQGRITSDGPVTLTGTETGEKANFIKAFGLKIECPGTTYVGHKVNSTEPILSGSSEATLTPTYKKCEVAELKWPATVAMGSCDYVVALGNTKATPADTYAVTASFVCPAGEITINIWTPGTDHEKGVAPMCIIHLGEAGNQNRNGGTLTDTTQGGIANDLDLTGTFTGVSAEKTKSATDPLLCPAATTTTGELSVDVTVKGDSKAGAATGVSLSHL
jgi:hypothetical protein